MKVFLVNVMELEKKLITVPHLKALFVVKSPCNTKPWTTKISSGHEG